MPIRTIAVGLLSADEAEWLLPATSALAEHHGAHLIAVHPVEPQFPFVGAEMGYGVPGGPLFDQWQIEETEAIRKIFDHATQAGNYVAEWRSQPVLVPGAPEFLVDSVRCADLVVLGQLDPAARRRDHARIQEHAIRQSGRPVLVMPRKTAPAPIGQHALIGWSNTREAARAAHDALALVAPGAFVDIVFVGSGAVQGAEEDALRHEMAAALARHGFKTRLVLCPPTDGGVDGSLMRVAFEQGADLIVSGAFGHSRAYDFVIGAVTRGLLENARLPVLFAR